MKNQTLETSAPPFDLEMVKVGDLIPYAKNSRTHSPEQVAQIAGSIREFGFTNPVLIDGENSIIAGHGRVMAAQKLGMAEVPCMKLTHLTETQKRAYVIADNRLALNAGWDMEMLKLELSDLKEEDFNLDLLGFDNFAIEQILNPNERNDEAPESSGREVDIDGMEMQCACPKCGFEFDPK